jgi:hypothetical protein
MTDHKPALHPHGEGRPGGGIDSEIDVRRSIEIALWLAGITVGTLIVGYFIYRGLAKWTAEQDPAASPLIQANQVVAPPAPNLQLHPEQDLATMRAEEIARLTSWGWTDKSLGLAHMPIADAIARLAVPEPAPVTEVPAAPAALPAPEAAAPAAAHAEPVHAGSGH